jgi:hypothetical protein
MAMRAAQSANKAKSLYLSFFCMMFSFIVINVSRYGSNDYLLDHQ